MAFHLNRKQFRHPICAWAYKFKPEAKRVEILDTYNATNSLKFINILFYLLFINMAQKMLR